MMMGEPIIDLSPYQSEYVSKELSGDPVSLQRLEQWHRSNLLRCYLDDQMNRSFRVCQHIQVPTMIYRSP